MDGVDEAAGVREGDVLAGKYRIEKVLGVGGMGVVVAARHLQLETKVAIKFLLPGMLANKDAVDRFAREARAAVRITGEHVARVLDVGTLETGAPFMVMEHLDGGDLAAWLQQRGALPIDQAVEFLLHASVAVAEAHSLGIVHRDLKPANLFCIRRADGKASIKVLDFGISKVTDLTASEGGMSLTKTSAMMGSPLYMSPEQMQSPKSVDAQTDVWALGVILYELLTARVPFDGSTLPEVAIKVATAVPLSVCALRPDVPPGLDAVVFKALEKAKADRYKSVAELALALAEFAPPRSKALVERICAILQVAGPSSMAPKGMQPQLLGLSPTVAAGTMAAVGRTTAGVSVGGKKRVVVTFAFLAVAGTIGAVATVGMSLRKNATVDVPAAAAAAATAAPSALVVVSASADARPVDSVATSLAPPRTDAAPTATTAAPLPRALAARSSKSRSSVAVATPPPPAAASTAPAALPPPSSQRKNQLDLGSFQ